ncbi:MAG: TRAP transporter large permease subunit [Myxococcota bacterium]
MAKRLGGAAVLCVLLIPLLLACAQLLHGQLLAWGEQQWPGYAAGRAYCQDDPGAATAAPTAAAAAASTAAAAPDPLVDELMAEDATPAAAEAAPAAADPSAVAEAPAGDDALLEGLDAPPAAPTAAAVASAAAAAAIAAPPMSAGQRSYCRFEQGVSRIGDLGITWMPATMVILLLLSAFVTTLRRKHIGLRDAGNALEDRISNGAQLLTNGFVLASSWTLYGQTEGVAQDVEGLWVFGTCALVLANVVQLVRPLPRADANGVTGTTVGRVLATIPLFAWMGAISGIWFFAVEHHPAGIAIYLQKITEYSTLYIQVGLYLWTGLMLRDTLLGGLVFDLIRPLRLPPELFAVVVSLAAAIPVAYSGASGVFVLALGATIYTEMRRAGATDELARATTAMSGSFGVVLPPCLLVVIVASLNLDVTTDELFYRGWQVFGLTGVIFLAIAWLTRRAPWRFGIAPTIGSDLGKAGTGLLPYLAIAGVVLVAFRLLLDAGLDEHTAPYLLAVAMLAVQPWDRLYRRKLSARPAASAGDAQDGATRHTALDTGTQIGALLMLMGLSACLGGVIERSQIIETMPTALGGPWPAMTLLVLAMIIIGMIMDPYGAVILVSVTLAPIAKANGIAPVHFWMMALVGFELGYLTPPVALNLLLTRQIVDDLPAHVRTPDPPQKTFFRRHERVLLPVLVRGVTMLIVAFVPLLLS